MGESIAIHDLSLDDLSLDPQTDVLEWLNRRGATTVEGLAALLDAAAEQIGSRPGQARRLAERVRDAAERAHLPALIARADYLCAQAYAIDAAFDRALALIESAHRHYLQANDARGAQRTHIGRIGVLEQLGRYDEAIALAEQLRHELSSDPSPEATALIAKSRLNLGVCYLALGRPEQALDAYAQAEALFGRLDDAEGSAQVMNNQGVVLLELGRADEAAAMFERAAAMFATRGLDLERAHAVQNIGYAHLLRGRYSEAFAALERARAMLRPLDATAEKQALLLDLADAYLRMNLYAEAEIGYREAAEMLQTAGMAYEHGRALWGWGAALMQLGRLPAAERALSAAADRFRSMGNALALCNVMMQQAMLHMRRGQVAAARAVAEDALNMATGRPLQQSQAHLVLARLALPDIAAARSHLRAAEELAAQLDIPHIRYQVLEQLGSVCAASGDDAQAEHCLLRAIALLETQRIQAGHERMRAAFVSDKIGAYDELIRLWVQPAARDARNPARIQRAFEMTERARARALLDRLSDAHGAGSATAADPHLLAEQRALRVKLDVAYTALFAGHQTDGAGRSLEARIVELEQALGRSHLRAELDINLAAGAPLELNAIRAALPLDAALISYYVLGERIIAFIVHPETTDEIRVIEVGRLEAVRAGLEKLSVHWERIAGDPVLARRHADPLERSARHVLAALYDALLRPLEAHVRRVRWVIVPHGLLHQVPFHALHDGERYVIEQREVRYAPSASVLALCAARSPAPHRQGVAIFGAADAHIPAADAEARAIAALYPTTHTRLYVDRDATRAALAREAARCHMLHLACHGLFRADNPMFSSLKLHDGWLMGADVACLDLHGATVVLSACESGRSEAMAGDEILGMTRAFLSAGASALVVSLWLVNDRATTELMIGWHRRLQQGAAKPAALRAAQLAVKQTHPHPFFWAPFVLIGKE